MDRVVPFRMERVAADVESLDFGVGDLDALLIGPLNESTSDGDTRRDPNVNPPESILRTSFHT